MCTAQLNNQILTLNIIFFFIYKQIQLYSGHNDVKNIEKISYYKITISYCREWYIRADIRTLKGFARTPIVSIGFQT